LQQNEEETQKWTAYRDEQQDFQNHLKEYAKTPKVDILVPIGGKSLMPGYLYHTSEVLVSHGSGYFSDCTATQAMEIADKRVKVANERLADLAKERELYQNKLQFPFSGDTFGDSGQEIIEEYNEEREAQWRKEHHQRVKEQKQIEAKSRIHVDQVQTNENIMSMLDDLELMEELADEMEAMDTGEPRNSIVPVNPEPVINENENSIPDGSDIDSAISDDDEESDENISEEMQQLLESTKSMGKKQKVKVFRAKLEEVCAAFSKNAISVEERLRLYDLHYEIEEALDFLVPQEESCEKKIHFAEEDEVKPFDKKEAACKISEDQITDGTLYLEIKHSPAANAHEILGNGQEIKSPADIYRLFGSQNNEEPVIKSILKNKDMVLAETHGSLPPEKKTKKKVKTVKIEEVTSNVIGDIVERKPEEHSDDRTATTNKKVSKFKKSRYH
jgi:unconventional prefoldin RPB5 interactor 1